MSKLKQIKETIEKLFSEDYKYTFNDSTIELVKNNQEFTHYLLNGLKDGSGGVYPLIYELCKTFKPNHVVELGNREGLGIISIYEGINNLSDVKLSTIDIVNDLRFVPQHIRNDNRVNFIFGNVLDEKVVEQVKNNGPIDIMLLDTIHTAEQFEAEWNLYKPLCSKDAIILVDDLHYDTKHLFFNKIKQIKFEDSRIHGSGFGVILNNE